MVLRADPGPVLARFVATLWASAPSDVATGVAPIVIRERILPTGLAHVAFRLHGPPLVLYRGAEDLVGSIVGHAVACGPRTEPYLRDAVLPAVSVGAQLRAGAVERIFGVPADALAGRHVPLAELWGADADRVLADLTQAATATRRIEILTRALERRVQASSAGPAVPVTVRRALLTLADSADVAIGALAGAVSRRHFTDLFARSVGVTPKRFARVRRFQNALARLGAAPDESLASIALSAGYADQAHFTREFVAFAGVSPSRYRVLAPAQRGHLPLPAPATSLRNSSRPGERPVASSGA
jgi:AraC-like DNA-binding protein